MQFFIYIDHINKKCTKSKKVRVGHITLNVVEFSEGTFANVASNYSRKPNLVTWNLALKDSGMIMNESKTKVMVMGDELVNTKIEVEQVWTFQYLGVRIDGKGTQDADINQKIEKTMKLYHWSRNNFFNKKRVPWNNTKSRYIRQYTDRY